MTAKLPVRGMTSQLQSVGGGKQALATPLTETPGPASALPSLLAPETGLKVCYACCVNNMHLTTVTQLIVHSVCFTHANTITVPNQHKGLQVSGRRCVPECPLRGNFCNLCVRPILMRWCTCRVPSGGGSPGPGDAWEGVPSHGNYLHSYV